MNPEVYEALGHAIIAAGLTEEQGMNLLIAFKRALNRNSTEALRRRVEDLREPSP